MNKISIIGTGSVGSTIAYTLTVCGLASEIVLIDINNEKAMGEAMDIRQGLPYCNPCTIYAGTYEDMKGSEIVIVTMGVARKPGQSRLELAQINVDILKSITPDLTKYAGDAVFLIVSNPVDILTYAFCKCSGLPESRVIGSGTILDTARVRARLSEYFKISQDNVHAYVLGEHGDSSFVPWSLANISNIPVEECYEAFKYSDAILPKLDYDEIEEYVRKSGGKIIQRKGATFYAVSAAVCHVAKCIMSGIDTTMTVSTMMNGEYGISDVCLSTLNTVGKGGVRNKVILPLDDSEIKSLQHSANTLKDIINNVEI